MLLLDLSFIYVLLNIYVLIKSFFLPCARKIIFLHLIRLMKKMTNSVRVHKYNKPGKRPCFSDLRHDKVMS